MASDEISGEKTVAEAGGSNCKQDWLRSAQLWNPVPDDRPPADGVSKGWCFPVRICLIDAQIGALFVRSGHFEEAGCGECEEGGESLSAI